MKKIGWRKLHTEELCNLYSLSDVIRTIKSRRTGLAGDVARTGEKRIAYMSLVGKAEGKGPLGRHRLRWRDIKVALREIGWGGMDWIDLAQDRRPVEGCFEHGNEPPGAITSWEIPEWQSDGRLLKEYSALWR
jgi:hypothetical protein